MKFAGVGANVLVADLELPTNTASADVLVYNAENGSRPEAVPTMSEAAWDRVLAVNLKGAFLCVQAAAPALRGRRVNCVCPGSIDTPWLGQFAPRSGELRWSN